MPLERRQIVLSNEETILAIRSFARTNPAFLPEGEILRAEPQQTPEGVVLDIAVIARYGRTETAMNVLAENEQLLEVLIRCCLENNIPIPRASAKYAVIIDGCLALELRHESSLGEAPAAPSVAPTGRPATVPRPDLPRRI